MTARRLIKYSKVWNSSTASFVIRRLFSKRAGLRGSNLRMSHEVTYQIFRYVAENLVFLSKADRKNGNLPYRDRRSRRGT